MFSRAPASAIVERFIGALTMALGVGALIPRVGNGLYAALENSGDRGMWALVMMSTGCWTIAVSYMRPTAFVRACVLIITMAVWAIIGDKFVQASLWGAALQAGVIEIFALEALCRIFIGRYRHANEKTKH